MNSNSRDNNIRKTSRGSTEGVGNQATGDVSGYDNTPSESHQPRAFGGGSPGYNDYTTQDEAMKNDPDKKRGHGGGSPKEYGGDRIGSSNQGDEYLGYADDDSQKKSSEFKQNSSEYDQERRDRSIYGPNMRGQSGQSERINSGSGTSGTTSAKNEEKDYPEGAPANYYKDEEKKASARPEVRQSTKDSSTQSGRRSG